MLTTQTTPATDGGPDFNKAGIQLIVKYRPVAGGITSFVSFAVVKYRVLNDGASPNDTDFANDAPAYAYKSASIETDATTDPDVLAAFVAIQNAMQTLINAKAI